MKRNEFYTPAWVVELARGCMRGIDLDPASCAVANETVKAATFYDLKKNGLTRPWFGRVWLNPPYGKFSAPFVAMAVKELMAGRIEQAIILLRLNHLSTAWFHATMQAEHLICVPDGRINFASPNYTWSSNSSGSVLSASLALGSRSISGRSARSPLWRRRNDIRQQHFRANRAHDGWRGLAR